MPIKPSNIQKLQASYGKENILSLLLNSYYTLDNQLQEGLEQKGWKKFSHSHSMIFLNMAEGRQRSVDIAKHMGISKQAVNRSIKELVELGLIELQPDPEDKRAKLLILTAKGAVVTEDATKSLLVLEEKLKKQLGTKGSKELKQLLKAILEQ